MRAALLIAALLASCAHTRSADTPQFRACKLVCAQAGFPLARVDEDEEAINCECRKPPLPAPAGT